MHCELIAGSARGDGREGERVDPALHIKNSSCCPSYYDSDGNVVRCVRCLCICGMCCDFCVWWVWVFWCGLLGLRVYEDVVWICGSIGGKAVRDRWVHIRARFGSENEQTAQPRKAKQHTRRRLSNCALNHVIQLSLNHVIQDVASPNNIQDVASPIEALSAMPGLVSGQNCQDARLRGDDRHHLRPRARRANRAGARSPNFNFNFIMLVFRCV